MERLVTHLKNEPFENLMVVIAIIEPLSTIPQIIEIYATRSAESVSLLSWLLFAGASMMWLIYGIRIKSIPLIASSVMWIMTECALILGILQFG